MNKKLYKGEENKIIFGVCSGLADYFDIDPTIVRIAFAISTIFLGLSIWVYIVMAVIMPSDNKFSHKINNSKKKNLYRNEKNKMIFGVCSGLADYFDIDVTIVRIIFLSAIIFAGTSFWVYIVMAILIPVNPDNNDDENIFEYRED